MYSIRATDAPWNIVMDGTTDNAVGLAALSAHILSLYAVAAQLPKVVFPEGICAFTGNFPDFAFPRFQMAPDGHVRFRRLDTNPIAVHLNGAIRNGFVRNMDFGPFVIEGGALKTQCVHTSRIRADHRGGFAGPAFITAFSVCTEFWYNCSVNDWGVEGWHGGIAPTIGIHVTKSDAHAAERTSGSTYHNPIIEGLNRGAVIDHADGNAFLGGTMEACYDWGMYFDAVSQENKVVRGWFEANGASGGGDVFAQGNRNVVLESKSTNLIKFYGSADCQIKGGTHRNIDFAASAARTIATDLAHTGTMTGSAYKSRIMNLATGVFTP